MKTLILTTAVIAQILIGIACFGSMTDAVGSAMAAQSAQIAQVEAE